jgi:23S rRNA (adenine1618-N6)-methyltransferase
MKAPNHDKVSDHPGLHPRNAHRSRYDFEALVAANPELTALLKRSPVGDPTIDFADPVAVKALNRALLMHHYGIQFWDIPPGYLCPPVPGRADYIHYLADLLSESSKGVVPTGEQVRVLDIGVGANCIYPIIGNKAYGWRFVGTDIDPVAVSTAQQIIAFNPSLKDQIEIRRQFTTTSIFKGIWAENERFDAVICNPPFHASKAQADAQTARKLRSLGLAKASANERNFGGHSAELYVDGGELGFIKRMISQSRDFSRICIWFTTIVSNAENLKPLYSALEAARPFEVKTIDMHQGQKSSRILAWTYMHPKQRAAWRKRRAEKAAGKDDLGED